MLSEINPIHVLRHNSFRTNLILFFYLLLGFPGRVSLSYFPNKILYLFHVSLCMLIFVALKILAEQHN